jgi:acetyl-CoA synthetase
MANNRSFEDTDTILMEHRLFSPSPQVVEHANIMA